MDLLPLKDRGEEEFAFGFFFLSFFFFALV